MSSPNRKSKECPKDRQSLDKQRRSKDSAERPDLCRCSDPPSRLSVYNVRFPANICQHKAPFAWQPTAPPGRGGGTIVVPTEKTSRPKTKKSPRKLSEDSVKSPREASTATTVVQEVPKSPVGSEVARETKMSASEVKILKRETKNR